MAGTLRPDGVADLIVVPLFRDHRDLRPCPGIMRSLYELPGVLPLIRRSGGEQEVCSATAQQQGLRFPLTSNWSCTGRRWPCAVVCPAGPAARPDAAVFHGRVARSGGAAAGLPGHPRPAPGTVNGQLRLTGRAR